MAKVTITIEDTENGQQKVHFEFDPPGQKDVPYTPAQELGIAIANSLSMDSGETKVNGEAL